MLKTSADLLKEFPSHIHSSVGDKNAKFSQITAVENSRADSLVFASTDKHLNAALDGKASVIVTSKKLWNDKKSSDQKCILFSENVGVAQAVISTAVTGRFPKKNKKIHSTAVIAKSAHIGLDVTIGPFVVIGENCTIGDGAYIGAQSILEDGSSIGKETIVWAQLYLGNKCQIGNYCVVHPQCVVGSEGFGFAQDKTGQSYRIPHNGIVIIEDNVELGAHCAIDRAVFEVTRVGEGSKFDNHVHIAHNCIVGKHCLFVGGAMLGGSSQLGDKVFIGGGTFVTDHAKITSNVMVGGLSGVTFDITEPGLYGGHPIQPLKDYLRRTATMVHLVEMRKNISLLMKKMLEKEK